MPQDHWRPGFNFDVEERDAKGLTFETLADLPLARRGPRRLRGRRHPEGDW
jgi:hypothetical protein